MNSLLGGKTYCLNQTYFSLWQRRGFLVLWLYEEELDHVINLIGVGVLFLMASCVRIVCYRWKQLVMPTWLLVVCQRSVMITLIG